MNYVYSVIINCKFKDVKELNKILIDNERNKRIELEEYVKNNTQFNLCKFMRISPYFNNNVIIIIKAFCKEKLDFEYIKNNFKNIIAKKFIDLLNLTNSEEILNKLNYIKEEVYKPLNNKINYKISLIHI